MIIDQFQTGDELSKRSKFVFCTWIGPNVSVMKKAKMGTDKALVKDVIQVENQLLHCVMMMMMMMMTMMMMTMMIMIMTKGTKGTKGIVSD